MNSLVSLIMSVLKFLLKAFSGNTSKKDTPVPKVEERAEEVVDTRVEPIEIPETPPPETTTKTEEVKVAYTQDKATLDRIQKAHPKVREELRVIYNEICAALTGKAHCRFAYVLRTMDEQAALYAQGRESFRDVNAKRQKAGMYLFKTADENKSKVTNAAAGLSIHNYGLACFDEKTRVITDKGFKFFRELDGSEKVMAYNKDTQTTCMEFPIAYLSKYYKGNMVRIKTRSVDQFVTVDHKVVYRKAYPLETSREWEYGEAKDLSYHHEIPVVGEKHLFERLNTPPYLQYRKSQKLLDIKDTEALWAFMGYYISEGSCRGASTQEMKADSNRYKITISQSKEVNPDVWVKIRDILDILGITYSYRGHDFSLHCKDMHALLFPLGGSHRKYIPEWLFAADENHLSRLYEALIDGDGSRYEGHDCYFTVSERLASDFCRLSLMLGKPVSYQIKTPKAGHILPHGEPQKSPTKVQYTCLTRNKKTALLKNGDHKNTRITQEYFEGEVYCAQVPSGALVIERNGKISISGNCDIVLLLDKDGNGTYESASWDTKTDFDADHISDWLEIVAIFKKHGWVWGGDWTGFKDLPHFEKTFGHKPSDLLIAYKSGKKDAEGYVII